MLSGAPLGYRYVRKSEAAARYEIIDHEAAVAAELFRRYADEGASIAALTRWLTDQGVPTRTGKPRLPPGLALTATRLAAVAAVQTRQARLVVPKTWTW